MTEQASGPGFSTLAIHAGAQPDPGTGARATPIFQTTSFVFDDVDHAASLFGLQAFGNIYSRITNPTNAVLEERVAALEGGTAALAVASGHAAEFLVFHTLLQPGDEFVAANKLYGGSINQFNHSYKNFDWRVKWADPDDIGTFEAEIPQKTKDIFVESLANPGGVIVDIAAIAAIAKKARIPLIVDNTLASPYLMRPFEHGADIIVQHTDSTAAMQVAEERGLKGFGQSSDMIKFAPKAQMTAIVDNWGPHYIKAVKAVLDGTWKANDVWEGIKDGTVHMADYTNMADDTKKLAEETQAKIAGGWNPFTGPIYDQSGKERYAAGVVAPDADLLGMNWYVKGVDDKLPQ